jgi:hypothetical protein
LQLKLKADQCGNPEPDSAGKLRKTSRREQRAGKNSKDCGNVQEQILRFSTAVMMKDYILLGYDAR